MLMLGVVLEVVRANFLMPVSQTVEWEGEAAEIL